MEKIDAEATRLGREVSRGKRRYHSKSIFFLCKGAIAGILPRMTKQGRSRRIEAITWATAIKLIVGFKASG